PALGYGEGMTMLDRRPLAVFGVDGVLFPLSRRRMGPIVTPPGHVEDRIWGLNVSYLPELPAFLRALQERCILAWESSWAGSGLRAVEQSWGRQPGVTVADRGGAWTQWREWADGRPLLWCCHRRPGPACRAWLEGRRAQGLATLRVTPSRHLGLTA